jgi:hypothetical protein
LFSSFDGLFKKVFKEGVLANGPIKRIATDEDLLPSIGPTVPTIDEFVWTLNNLGRLEKLLLVEDIVPEWLTFRPVVLKDDPEGWTSAIMLQTFFNVIQTSMRE